MRNALHERRQETILITRIYIWINLRSCTNFWNNYTKIFIWGCYFLLFCPRKKIAKTWLSFSIGFCSLRKGLVLCNLICNSASLNDLILRFEIKCGAEGRKHTKNGKKQQKIANRSENKKLFFSVCHILIVAN